VSGIAGVIELKGSKKDKQKINILLDKISHRGSKREILGISGGYIGINTSYDFETRVGQNIVLMDGRIYNLDHLMTEYNIQENNSLISDSEKICLLLNKAGKNIFRDFKGSFALVIVDKEEKEKNKFLQQFGGEPSLV